MLQEIGLDGVGEESIEDFLRTVLLDFFGNVALDFKPGLFQQAGPHVDALDGLREEWSSVAAEDVVIDIDELFLGRDVHAKGIDSIRVGLSQ